MHHIYHHRAIVVDRSRIIQNVFGGRAAPRNDDDDDDSAEEEEEQRIFFLFFFFTLLKQHHRQRREPSGCSTSDDFEMLFYQNLGKKSGCFREREVWREKIYKGSLLHS